MLQRNCCTHQYMFGILNFEVFLALTQLPIPEHIIYTPAMFAMRSEVSNRMHFHNKEKNKNNNRLTAAITIFTLGIIFASTSSPVIATTGNNTGLELSPQPVWDEVVVNTGAIPINETHTIVTFIGNGTMSVPGTGQTINMINNGYGIISPLSGNPSTISASGREAVYYLM